MNTPWIPPFLLLALACGDPATGSSRMPEWRRAPRLWERAVAWVSQGVLAEAPADPRRPPGSVWIEPGVAAQGEALRCVQDGAPVADAVWSVDLGPEAAAPGWTAPAAGSIVRCGVGAARSPAVVVHGGELPQNVLFILLDDVGVVDVGAYGVPGAAPTPRIDRLAAEGVRFEHAWSNPLCSPTRASLLTGVHPMNHGLGVFTDDGAGPSLDGRWLSVADVARARGVGAAGVFGKWHVGSGEMPIDHPARLGFTWWEITPGNLDHDGQSYERYDVLRDGTRQTVTGYAPIDTVNAASRFIQEQRGPWFAWVALHLAHAPFHDPPAELAAPRPALPGRPGQIQRYLAMVEAADALVGRLVDSLPDEARARTVVIVMGDNGTPSGAARAPVQPVRAKDSVYEGGVRVPLIVWGPSVAAPGRVVDAAVSAVDLLPTVADLLGRSLDPGELEQVDGTSFADTLWTEHLPPDGRTVYAEIFGPNTHVAALRRNHRRVISDGVYKVVRTPEGDAAYDLRADPWEARDLLRSASPPPQVASLLGLFDRYRPRAWPPPGWPATDEAR